jgi:hypothetical protein
MTLLEISPSRSSMNPLGMVADACNPSYLEGRGRRITSSRPAWAKLARPYLKTKCKQKGWGCGSNGRALT